MKTVCPNCESDNLFLTTNSGLIKCAHCYTQYDGFSHLRKHPDPATDVSEIAKPTAQQPQIKYFVIFAFIALLAAAKWWGGYRDMQKPAAPSSVSVPAKNTDHKITIRPTAIPSIPPAKDPAKILVTDIEFNMVAANTFFVRMTLENNNTTKSEWPALDIAFLSKGKIIERKLVKPIEYLASQVASGKTPDTFINPQAHQIVWVNISLTQTKEIPEDYQINPVYPE